MELALGGMFVNVSGIQDSDKARAIYDGIISFEIRLGILDRLMPFERIDDTELEMWIRLSSRLSKFYKKRHELAHFGIVQHGDNWVILPFLTWEKIFSFNPALLTETQILERSSKFDELEKAVEWFNTHAVYRRTGMPQDRQLLDAEPPLVPRIRELAIQNLAKNSPPPQS